MLRQSYSKWETKKPRETEQIVTGHTWLLKKVTEPHMASKERRCAALLVMTEMWR